MFKKPGTWMDSLDKRHKRKFRTHKQVLGRTTHLLSFDTILTAHKATSPSILLLLVQSLQRFTKPLPSNDMGLHTQTHRMFEGM
jgi:hypothetical protein